VGVRWLQQQFPTEYAAAVLSGVDQIDIQQGIAIAVRQELRKSL